MFPSRTHGFGGRGCALALAAALGGCSIPRPMTMEAHESFDSTSTYSRTYASLEAQTCEAARRTLLSQGYVISMSTPEQVRGRKSFQPTAETHDEIEFNVVCAKDGFAGHRTIAFVNAVQDRFALKKSNSSASVGVGALGSLSLPFTGSDDSLVKVASLTITSAPFYERFFVLVERYLAGDPGQRIDLSSGTLDKAAPAITVQIPAPSPVPVPLPSPVPAAAGSAAR